MRLLTSPQLPTASAPGPDDTRSPVPLWLACETHALKSSKWGRLLKIPCWLSIFFKVRSGRKPLQRISFHFLLKNNLLCSRSLSSRLKEHLYRCLIWEGLNSSKPFPTQVSTTEWKESTTKRKRFDWEEKVRLRGKKEQLGGKQDNWDGESTTEGKKSTTEKEKSTAERKRVRLRGKKDDREGKKYDRGENDTIENKRVGLGDGGGEYEWKTFVDWQIKSWNINKVLPILVLSGVTLLLRFNIGISSQGIRTSFIAKIGS